MQEGRIPATRVSVGVPVYNGANFLAEALDSILSQTFESIEVVISDNASTDATADICRAYAQRDKRVRVVRNRENIGAAPNYNQVFRLSRGEFFMIANHDDIHEPTFIEKCVAVLDENQEVVCAYPLTVDIDEDGRITGELPSRPAFSSVDPQTRVWEALKFGDEPMAIFGVMRSEVVARTGLMPSAPSADRVWLAELLMHGPFYEIPEPLFLHREFPERSTHAAGIGHASMAWWDPARKKTFAFPYWRMMGSLISAINRSPMTTVEKMSSMRFVPRWAFTNRHHLKLLYDLAVPLRPVIDRLYRARAEGPSEPTPSNPGRG